MRAAESLIRQQVVGFKEAENRMWPGEQCRAEKQLEGLAGVLGSPVRGVALLQVRKDEGPAQGQEDGP